MLRSDKYYAASNNVCFAFQLGEAKLLFNMQKKKKGHGTIQDLFIMKKGWRASFNLSGLREREREHQERPKKRTLRTGCVVKNGNYTEKMRQEYNLRTAGDSKSGGRGKGARESSLGGMGEGSRPAGAGTARAPGRPRRRAT